jgi:hypothetical protein
VDRAEETELIHDLNQCFSTICSFWVNKKSTENYLPNFFNLDQNNGQIIIETISSLHPFI